MSTVHASEETYLPAEPPPPPPPPADPARRPQARLAAGVQRLRSRVGDSERRMLLIGGLLMPLGVLLVVLGWYGASQTVLVFEQIPYLVSGGLLGLGCLFAGGFIYFSHWQSIRIREARAHHQQLLGALGRIETLLASGQSSAALAALHAVGGDGVAAPAAYAGALVTTAKGSMVHRPDCSVVAGRDDVRPVVNGEADGRLPCKLCDPFGDR